MPAEHLASVDLADNGIQLNDHGYEIVERLLVDIIREPPVS